MDALLVAIYFGFLPFRGGCLNPYFNGCFTGSLICQENNTDGFVVSILILMDALLVVIEDGDLNAACLWSQSLF